MKIIYYFYLFYIYILLANNNLVNCTTILNKFKLESYESYGSLSSGCEVYAGVVLQDSNDIKEFSSNVITSFLQLESNDLKVYFLTINKLPFGINNKIDFDVTNSYNITSTITLNLIQQYNCKELRSPINYNFSKASGYTVENIVYYDFDFDFDLMDISSSSLNCNTNFGYCSFSRRLHKSISIKVIVELNSLISNSIFKINLIDNWNGITEIIVDRPRLFQIDNQSTTTIENISSNYNNNSNVNPNDKWIVMLMGFKDLNSWVYLYFNNQYYYSTLAFGTNDKTTYLFTFQVYQGGTVTIYDAAKEIKVLDKYLYTYNNALLPSHSGIFKSSTSQVVNYNSTNLIYKLNQFELSNLIQGYSVRINSTDDIPLPYGYSTTIINNGGSAQKKWLLNCEYLVPPIRKPTGFTFVINGTQKTNSESPDITFPNIIIQDSKPPSLRSIKIKLLENNKILTRLHITDEGSGVNSILSSSPQFQVLAFNYLVSGTLNDGIFEIISDIAYSGNKVTIELVDFFGTSSKLSYYVNENLDNTGYFIPNLGDISIKEFNFNRLEIDTSFDNLELQLLIKFSDKNNILPPPYIGITNTGMTNKLFFGKYIKESDCFQIDIKVPARESGYLKYSFYSIISDSPIVSSALELLFPSQKVLLKTNYIDHFPPTIEEIKLLDQIQNNTDGMVTVGWSLTIKDFPVGLDYGYFEINSDVDINPIIFNIKPDENIPSSDTLSSYKLEFKIEPKIKQTFIISKCKLVDKNGYISQYPTNQLKLKVINPLIYLGSDPNRYSLTYIPSSSTLVEDLLSPTLLTLEYPSTFDSYLPNRILTFKFSTMDQGNSGISLNHNPYIYIQNFETYIRVKSEFIRSDESSIHYYNATTEIPYGFFYGGAIVSIHGITDNNLNVASYLSDDLNQLGLQSSIINPSPLNLALYPPIILEFTSITQNGGTLYIYGRNFGISTNQAINVYCDLNDGNGFNKLTIQTIENTTLSVLIPKILGKPKLIKIQIIKTNSNEQLKSNIISLLPIEIETQVILNCTKLSNCNNNGVCINGECQCYNGWYGLDCSSNKTLEIGKPEDDKPTFSFYGSLIEIKQIIETDINGKNVNEYNLTNWNYQFESLSSIYPNSSSYIYTSTLNNDLKTSIQVIISVFNNKSSIAYANQILNMEENSIKYTISMGQYNFKTLFNSLKFIIKTSISDTNEKCSFYDYALNNNNEIEWIKLKINSNTTIMGKFIQTGIIDYRIIKVSNQLLVPPTSKKQEAIIGVVVPFYRNNILLDPDFQVLVDFQKNNKSSSCYLNNQHQNENKKLTTAQLSSIITVSVFVALTLIVVSVLLLKKKIYFDGIKPYFISSKTIKDTLELDIKK